jgi:hypothetical protein
MLTKLQVEEFLKGRGEEEELAAAKASPLRCAWLAAAVVAAQAGDPWAASALEAAWDIPELARTLRLFANEPKPARSPKLAGDTPP